MPQNRYQYIGANEILEVLNGGLLRIGPGGMIEGFGADETGIPEAPDNKLYVRQGGATPDWVEALYLPLVGGILSGPLTLFGNPAIPNHAANKAYVDTGDTARLPLAGGTMVGRLILNPDDQMGPNDAATMGSVAAGFLSLNGGTLTGPVTLNANPAQPLQAATKQYVDSLLAPLKAEIASLKSQLAKRK